MASVIRGPVAGPFSADEFLFNEGATPGGPQAPAAAAPVVEGLDPSETAGGAGAPVAIPPVEGLTLELGEHPDAGHAPGGAPTDAPGPDAEAPPPLPEQAFDGGAFGEEGPVAATPAATRFGLTPSAPEVIRIDGASAAKPDGVGGGSGGGNGGGGGGEDDGGSGGSTGSGGYDVTLEFAGFAGTGLDAAFAKAAGLIESWILADLPDVKHRGQLIDDIVIEASLVQIDGEGGVLGQAGPTLLRGDGYLPLKGIMEFDAADASYYDSLGLFDDIVLHEMVHCLGFGTLWGDAYLDLTADSGGGDERFTGANANLAYRMGVEDGSIAADDAGYLKGVPIEMGGGAGTAGGHWRESALGDEIMTGYIDGTNLVESVSIAALEDMGYDTVWDDPADSADLFGPLPADDVLFG
jgi:hypothetical protein